MFPRTEFILDWTLKTLGVAAAIVFGIWAPISYQATADGNADNNASQESVASRLSGMSVQATSAAYLQSSALNEARRAASVVAELKTRMDNMATLSVWDFCEGRSSRLSACAELSARVDIGDVISSIVEESMDASRSSPTSRTNSVTATTTLTSAPTSAPEPSENGSRGISVSLAVALGVVFGVLVLGGLVMGMVVWRGKMVRRRGMEEVYQSQ
jgi:hypothetical protein